MTNGPTQTGDRRRALPGKLRNLVLVSILWSVCSIPICTVGAASCALYDCILYAVRGNGPEPVWKRFFRVFRRDFRPATGMTLLYGIFFLALYILDILFMAIVAVYPDNGTLPILHLIFRAILILPACTACWLFPLIARFHMSGKMLRVTAWKLTFQQLASSAVMVLIVVLAALACLRLYLIPLLILPALACLVCSFIMERIFARYEADAAQAAEEGPAARGG